MFTSKKSKKTINDTVYVFKKWNALTVNKEGFKLGKTLLPCLTTLFDNLNNKAKLEEIGIEESQYHFTEAALLLQDNLDSDHFQDLCVKLLKSVVADGEPLDTEDSINNHFEEHEEDFYPVLMQAFKENILDFFMKTDMFRSKIEGLMPYLTKLKELSKDVNSQKEKED